MNRNKTIALIIALFGICAAGYFLYKAIRFYRIIQDIARNNPALTVHDSLHVSARTDTLYEVNAELNRKIADILHGKPDTVKEKQQVLLYNSINDFQWQLDTVQNANLTGEETLKRVAVLVNKANLGCRACLFDINAQSSIPLLDTFVLLPGKPVDKTMFACLGEKEISMRCFETIRHTAYELQYRILIANLQYLQALP